MGTRRKQILLQQKATFEGKLKARLAFLSGKGIGTAKAEKDPLARELKAEVKASDRRLKRLAEYEKRTEEMARIKAERAAAPKQKEEAVKAEKPKKTADTGKPKKIKEAPEGGKMKKAEEPKAEPAAAEVPASAPAKEEK